MPRAAAVLLAAGGVAGQAGGDGISKNTYSVSNPAAAYRLMTDLFPCDQAGWSPECMCSDGPNKGIEACCPCGGVGRVQFTNPKSGFSLHTVNSSTRTYGARSTAEVEALFAEKYGDFSQYDAFMDLNTGLVVSNLDPYVAQLQKLKADFMPLSWTSSTTKTTFYSLIFQIGGQVVVELVSDRCMTCPGLPGLSAAPYDRIYWDGKSPAEYYGDYWAGDESAGKPQVQLGKISHFTWNITRDSMWYEQVLAATLRYKYDAPDGTLAVRVYGFPAVNSIAQVHLVQRPDAATKGAFKARDFEDLLNGAHALSADYSKYGNAHTCGFDKWYDHHWCLDQQQRTLKDYADAADAFAKAELGHDAYYHAWQNPTNFYMVEPGGIAIQLDAPCGNWDGYNCQSGQYFDPTLCSQGYCQKDSSDVCASGLRAACPALNMSGVACTDCAAARAADIAAAKCTNADVLTYCLGGN